MYIYITRHGLTNWNTEGKLQGHSDSPLTEQGKEDALALGELMKNYSIDKVYSSPLKRAYDTSKLIFPDCQIIVDDRLKEMGFGVYEGKIVKSLLNDDLYDTLWNHPENFDRIPEGESYEEVFNRLNSFLEDLKKENANHVFITIHGMLFVILMAIVKKIEIKDLVKINHNIVRGGSLTIIEANGDDYRVVEEGISTHLKNLSIKTLYK